MFYIIFLIGFLLSLFNKRMFFYFFALILAITASMRYGIGPDYFSYEYLFNRLQLSPIDEFKYGVDNQEIGFRMLGSLLKELGFSYQQYLMFFAAIDLFFLIKISKRYSKNPTLTLLFYFSFYYLTWTISAIRQSATIAIGLYYLLKCIEEKKGLKLVSVSLLLSLIHAGSLILIPMYLLSKIDFKKKQLLSISVISIILSAIPTGFVISKLTWIPFLNRVIPYINTQITFNLLDFQGLGRLFFLILAFVFYDHYAKQNDMYKKTINLYILSISLYFVLQFSELTAGRLGIYGKYLDIIFLANVLYLYKFRVNRLLYTFGVFALCLVYLYKDSTALATAIFNKNNEVTFSPYVHILNKDEFGFNSNYFKLTKTQ